MKRPSSKNKICLFLALMLVSASKLIAFHGSFALWGEPEPPKDLLK
ncbi:hypothetical protein CcarbDRAFT_5377 [Clostridium carboxidivorans P7]|uniref:Cyclic lactone autoinducer peptide n=1 Tax=Clostridium carboxidivorans P7 TaxID=536227 RepID=C6Q2V9_9CLOT|nr:hypothetical protein [Clostridium carboxidivorans]EET84175.1 hypothetical protein CcarbDRAFT_5377 [Clostridium carboxidivorans P7]EFG87082.1 hypothetical protein CLCAR_3181 [Clostridium carboxidivorans P7]